MSLDRRVLMTGSASLLAGGAALLARPAAAQAPAAPAAPAGDNPRLSERSMGDASAPMVVQEFFSLTCSHCGAFGRDTWPQVKAELVQTGKVRFVWRDFPLDQIALRAAVVARYFPTQVYEPFIEALFSTQDRWAFARGVDHKAEIGKIAAVAGMSSATFETAWADDETARGVLALRQQGERSYNIQATPTFVFNTRVVSGAIDFARFAQEAARG
jgi:protein-disulfide isomerase